MPNTMIAALDRGTQRKRLMVYRIFGIDQASNKLSTFKLPAGQVHCVAQFQTEYVAVSCDSGVEIFNVLAECHVRTIQGQGIF